MTSLSRPHASPSTALLRRILERPGLLAAVRELPGAVLGTLIARIGLEDAGDLVALASTAQLERVFDDELWRADRAGADETFRPERFALWLRVMLEAGEEGLVQRLCELPNDLVALAVHRLVLVLDRDVLEDLLGAEDEEAERIRRALEDSVVEEWEEFRLVARDADAWDDLWTGLLALDRDHHDRLRAILEQCCAMTTEYISGQGGLYQVLTADEMLDSDVAAARDDRRVAEGFVSPADARAFLELARRGQGGAGRDPITLAYFRGLAKPKEAAKEAPKVAAPRVRGAAGPAPARDRGTELATAADLRDLAMLLQEADVIAPAAVPLPARTAGHSNPAHPHLVAPLFEQAMSDLRQRDPERFSVRVRELGYLVNVWIAGGAHQGRRPRPVEAMERVLTLCEAGLRTQLGAEREKPTNPEEALAALVRTPADALFRRGFRAAG